MIRMHSIMMIENYIYIWISIVLLRISWFSYLLLSYEMLYLSYGFEMKLGRTGYLMGFIKTYAHR